MNKHIDPFSVSKRQIQAVQELPFLDANRRPWRSYLGPESWLATWQQRLRQSSKSGESCIPTLGRPGPRLSSQASQASACRTNERMRRRGFCSGLNGENAFAVDFPGEFFVLQGGDGEMRNDPILNK